MKSDAAKLAIAVLLDILDFSILSLMPGVGMVADIIMGVIALVLWGPVGLFAFWEALNPVEPVDAFAVLFQQRRGALGGVVSQWPSLSV